MGIIGWIVLGLIAGAVAKLLMPGRDPGGVIMTILLGIGGALVGGFTLTAAGDFVVAGLEPGTYILRVEPLDDAAPESFFRSSVTRRPVPTSPSPRISVGMRSSNRLIGITSRRTR